MSTISTDTSETLASVARAAYEGRATFESANAALIALADRGSAARMAAKTAAFDAAESGLRVHIATHLVLDTVAGNPRAESWKIPARQIVDGIQAAREALDRGDESGALRHLTVAQLVLRETCGQLGLP